MEAVSTMGSGTLGREFELNTLVKGIERVRGPVNSNFTSDSMVTFRLAENGAAYTVYRTGTFQIRGAKSKEELEAAEDVFIDVLDEIGVDVPEYEFEHVTSVFIEDLDQDVNLSTLSIKLGLENVEYEPEQFPGLVFRPEGLDCVLLIFGSGKVVITGVLSRDEAENAFTTLKNQLDEATSL